MTKREKEKQKRKEYKRKMKEYEHQYDRFGNRIEYRFTLITTIIPTNPGQMIHGTAI